MIYHSHLGAPGEKSDKKKDAAVGCTKQWKSIRLGEDTILTFVTVSVAVMCLSSTKVFLLKQTDNKKKVI